MKAVDVANLLKKRIPEDVGCWAGETYGFNGVDPDREVKMVLWAVTASQEVVDYAKKNGFDMLVSHHPHMMDNFPHCVFHTALDCCDGGMNDMWRDIYGVANPRHFDGTLGWHGQISPCTIETLKMKAEEFIGYNVDGEVWSVDPGRLLRSVVICSGLGGMVNDTALTTGADCYILGESCRKARETGFKAVLEIGHTKSERCGINLINDILNPHGMLVVEVPLELDRFGNEYYSRRKP